MDIQVKTKTIPFVTTGYSMPGELKDAIAQRAVEMNCTASALIVGVMTAYLEQK